MAGRTSERREYVRVRMRKERTKRPDPLPCRRGPRTQREVGMKNASECVTFEQRNSLL